MEQTTIAALAPLAPLACALLFTFIASHVRNSRTVPHTGLTSAEFDAAFTVWAEYRASEECYLAHKGEK